MAGELSIKISDFTNGSIEEILQWKFDMIQDVFQTFAKAVESDAKMNAPHTTGEILRASILGEVVDNKAQFSVNVDNAAYIEFGTGNFAASYLSGMPQWVQDYAWQFFVNGKGWLPESPFLIPAFLKNWDILIQDIKDVLNA